MKSAAEGEERGFHGGKRVKGRSRHVAVDSQGPLWAVHVTAANKAEGAEAAAVMIQAVERHPSLESFTADKSYQRQAEAAARERLGRDLHVTAKPAASAPKKALCPWLSAGASSGPSHGLANAACSPRNPRKPSLAPKPGSGAPCGACSCEDSHLNHTGSQREASPARDLIAGIFLWPAASKSSTRVVQQGDFRSCFIRHFCEKPIVAERTVADAGTANYRLPVYALTSATRPA